MALSPPPRLPNGERFLFDNPRLYVDDPDTFCGHAVLRSGYDSGPAVRVERRVVRRRVIGIAILLGLMLPLLLAVIGVIVQRFA